MAAYVRIHLRMIADIVSCCRLQYQPVLGSTLKGKDNFKQLIHGFAEVRTAASASCNVLLADLPCTLY